MSNAAILLGVEWGKLILLLGGTLIVTVVLVGGGAYLFLRVFASIMNSRRDSWESSAQKLGLLVDRSAAAIYKPFSGEFNGRKFTVSHYGVMRGEHSVDDHAAVEMMMDGEVRFSFEIEKPEYLLLDLFDAGQPETGHDIFDKVFKVSSTDTARLNQMLHIEMFGGESPTVLTDLLLAAKRFNRVKATDRSISLGVRCDFGRSDIIESTIKKAASLAGRNEDASKSTSQGVPPKEP